MVRNAEKDKEVTAVWDAYYDLENELIGLLDNDVISEEEFTKKEEEIAQDRDYKLVQVQIKYSQKS